MAPIIPIIGLVASLASGAAAVAGGIAANKRGKQLASRAEEAGGIEADRVRREGRRSIADRAVRFGASGAVLGTGSTLDVLADEAAEVEEAALLRAYGGDLAANNLLAQGKQALLGGIISGIGSVGSAVGFAQEIGDISKPGGTSPITVPSPLIGPVG